jgi:hypothetical protein
MYLTRYSGLSINSTLWVPPKIVDLTRNGNLPRDHCTIASSFSLTITTTTTNEITTITFHITSPAANTKEAIAESIISTSKGAEKMGTLTLMITAAPA